MHAKLGVVVFLSLRCDLCETELLVLGSGVLSHSVDVRIFLSFHVVGHFLSSRLSELFIFDVASPITFLFVRCLSVFLLFALSPTLDTFSIFVFAVCDIVYMLFKLFPGICLKPQHTGVARDASGSRERSGLGNQTHSICHLEHHYRSRLTEP